MAWIGDFRVGDTFDTKFTTVTTTGAPTQLAGSPVISAYPGNSTTQLTAGITLSVDFDGVTGLNNVRVVASGGNGYATATNYQLVITTGTVGGVSVVGYVVAEFSLEARSALMPTTAAITLDVSAAGNAGVDWANVASPTTSQTLSGTTVGVATAVTTVNGLAANVITATSIASNAITAAKVATDAIGAAQLATDAIAEISDGVWDEATSGHLTVGTYGQLGQVERANTATAGSSTSITLDASASAVDDYYTDQVLVITSGTGLNQARQITDYVGSTKVATVAPAWATNPGSGSVFVILPAGAATSAASIAGDVWDITLAGHLDAGSTGEALNAAGAAGDPWITTLPGSYTTGQAGHIVGTAIPDIAPGSAGALLRAGSNTATSIATALTANITGSLSGSVGSVTGPVGSVAGNVVGSVGSVTGAVGSVTAGVTVTTNNDKTGYALSAAGIDAILDDTIGDGSITMRQALRVLIASQAGKTSGGATTTFTIRNVADSANVIVATVDSSGNRTAVTVTP